MGRRGFRKSIYTTLFLFSNRANANPICSKKSGGVCRRLPNGKKEGGHPPDPQFHAILKYCKIRQAVKRKNIMGFCTYHIKKGKRGGEGGLGIHIDRIIIEREDNYSSFKNADPARTHLNISYPCNGYEEMSLPEAISKRLKEGYNARNKAGELKAIRKDACIYSEHVFTGTHEDLKEIEANPQRLQEWVQANRKFAEDMYGADNIVRFTLHLDETTPHIHCVIVNLTKKGGRLAAKEILGSPKDLKEKQDKYAEYMKPFGLKRGLEDTGITHEGAEEYYKRVNAAKKLEGELTVYKSNLFGTKTIDIDKTLENYNSKIAGQQEEIAMYKRKYEGLNRRNMDINKREKKLKADEEVLRGQQAKVDNINEILSQKDMRIEQLEMALDYESKAKKKAQEEQQAEKRKAQEQQAKANEELAKLQELKKYEGLDNSRKYIDESIKVREYYEGNVAKTIFAELTAPNNTWRDKQELYQAFSKELKKYGFKEDWEDNPFFDLLEEKANIQYCSRGIRL